MSATLTPQKKTKRKATISSGQNTLHSVAEQDARICRVTITP